jgi:SAM-dependent methyltransferase
MNRKWYLRNVLAHPAAYRFFQDVIMGQVNLKQTIARDYIRCKPKQRILDIGCGPGDMVQFLPETDYIGFDSNPHYIKFAEKKFAGRGHFFCAQVERDTVRDLESFDVILASQVIHHLTDEQASELVDLAFSLLKPGGRLVTIDPCYVKGQSPVSRFLISKDRGNYVRNENGYSNIVGKVFPEVRSDIRHDILRIPYTFLTMECKKPVVES